MKTYFPLFTLLVLILTGCKSDQNNMNNNIAENPLLSEWNTPFGVPPFDKIQNEDYLPAFDFAVKEHKEEIALIVNNNDEPTFENTIEALERSGKTLRKVSQVFYALDAANTNDTLKKVAAEIAPKLAAHRDDVNLDPHLFTRIKFVKENEAKFKLDAEGKKLLKETFKRFERAGANLNADNQKRLREINGKLATLSQQFGENLLAETNNFELHVTNKEDFGKLPSSLVSLAANEATKRGHDTGWSFTLQRPSINPFLQYSPNRELRSKMFDGYALRGDNDNPNDNKAILQEMVSLRVEKANLLGYDTHAANVLSNSMAETPQAVFDFMDKLWKPALEMAKTERAAMAKMMKDEGVEGEFKGSDWRHYVERIRKERYNFDENETRPYFEFNAVLNGAFMLADKLFGMQFKELTDIPKWHPSQQVYEVTEKDGKHIGVIYMDFFARESKRGGAWMNEVRAQSKLDGEVTPIVTNNFNFPAPSATEPSLLSFSEAQTLFHEFGHGLHGLLSDVKYESLSGTNVPRDFVEFPSQVMENWMSEPEVLNLYAKHYKTGEIIPAAIIKKMNDASNFNLGFATVEYMAAAYLDMAWHTLKETDVKDVRAFEKNEMNKLGLIDEIIPRYRSTYFAHIFSGGYSSGYYSYLWSEVLDADAFEAFKETSLFDQETAKRYRKLLSQGGSKEGMELYKEFRGREPRIEPLLKKKGFVNQ